MKHRPIIEHHKPDTAELRKRQAKRARMAALVRRYVALGDEAGFSRSEIGRAMITTGADLVAQAQDGPGAAAVLGATSGRVSPPLPRSAARRAGDEHFARIVDGGAE